MNSKVADVSSKLYCSKSFPSDDPNTNFILRSTSAPNNSKVNHLINSQIEQDEHTIKLRENSDYSKAKFVIFPDDKLKFYWDLMIAK